MKKILPIAYGILFGAFSFWICDLIVDQYSDSLKNTGGVILASELIGLKIVPFIGFLFGFYLAYTIFKEDKP